MRVERIQLLDLLRTRGNEKAAQRAADSLPRSIDLVRDRALLRRCGIDPNVLASILARGAPIVPPASAPSVATAVHPPGPRAQKADRHLHPHGESTPPRQRAGRSTGPRLTLSSREVDEALDGLTRAFFRPAVPGPGSDRLQHISSVGALVAMMLVVATVTVVAGVPAGAATAVGMAVVLTAAVLVVRRRRREQTRLLASRQET